MLAITASRLWAPPVFPRCTSTISNAVFGRSVSVVMSRVCPEDRRGILAYNPHRGAVTLKRRRAGWMWWCRVGVGRVQPMATFVVIHGGGDVGWHWHLVEAELRRLGHDVVAQDL